MIDPALAAGVGTAAVGVLAHATYVPNSPIFGRTLGRGPSTDRVVYLTFDDGPSRSATERILRTLGEQRVPATFFVVGEHVRMLPALAAQVASAGHEVGNHTQHHAKLHLLGPRRVREELRGAHDAIINTTGRPPRVFRAPHGYRNVFVGSVARQMGYTVVGWTYGVWDTDRPGAEIIRARVRKGLRPGAIILLHDGDGYDPGGDRSQTAEALEGIIADVRTAGYRFQPLGDLLKG